MITRSRTCSRTQRQNLIKMTHHMITRSRTRRQNLNKIAQVILDISQRVADTWMTLPNIRDNKWAKIKQLEAIVAHKRQQIADGCVVNSSVFETHHTSIIRTLNRACNKFNVLVTDIPNFDLLEALAGWDYC